MTSTSFNIPDHPILNLLDIHENSNLLTSKFIFSKLSRDEDYVLPDRATPLIEDVFFWVVEQNQNKSGNASHVLDVLSRIAFEQILYSHPITDLLLRYYLGCDTVTTKEATLGLLSVKFARSRMFEWEFVDPWLQEYLAANFMLTKLSKAVQEKPLTIRSLPKSIKDSIIEIDYTWGCWRIVFGLIHRDQFLKKHAGTLLSMIMDIQRKYSRLSLSMAIRFCAEAVYEAENVCGMAEKLDIMNNELQFSHVKVGAELKPYMMKSIGYFLASSPLIYSLRMSRFDLSLDDVHHIFTPVKSVSDISIQVLDLSHNFLGLEGAELVRGILVKTINLTHLKLSDCALGNDGCRMILQLLDCLPLVGLDLSKNELGDSAFSCFVSNMEYSPLLAKINFTQNNLTDSSAHLLAGKLQFLPQLSQLYLHRNMITGLGCHVLQESFSALPGDFRQVKDCIANFMRVGHMSVEDVQYHMELFRTKLNPKKHDASCSHTPAEMRNESRSDSAALATQLSHSQQNDAGEMMQESNYLPTWIIECLARELDECEITDDCDGDGDGQSVSNRTCETYLLSENSSTATLHSVQQSARHNKMPKYNDSAPNVSTLGSAEPCRVALSSAGHDRLIAKCCSQQNFANPLPAQHGRVGKSLMNWQHEGGERSHQVTMNLEAKRLRRQKQISQISLGLLG